jgi:hypothetical protein
MLGGPEQATRDKKSVARLGSKNPFFGIGPGIEALNKAAELAGTKVYAYDLSTFTLVNSTPFRSIRATVLIMPISAVSLQKKINTGVPFKGYYYFTSPQISPF